MRALVFLALAVLGPPGATAQPGARAAEAARLLRDTGLDTEECYRVRDVNISIEDLSLYLTDGYLIFARPLNGLRPAAVFSADVEGGDGEVLLMPPNRGERMSLAAFTRSPNLNEHFRSAVMVFSGNAAAAIAAKVRAAPGIGKSPEMGHLLTARWDSVVRNFLTSFEVRLVQDLLSPRLGEYGFFYAALAGRRLGNFDVVFDPRSRQQIAAGQLTSRDNRTYFDNWTLFEARSRRSGGKSPPPPNVRLREIKIDATIEPGLLLRATTRAKFTVSQSGEQPLAFEIARRMRVTDVLLDGRTAEAFQRESLRSNLIRGGDNEVFLVVPPEPLVQGKEYSIEFRHEGEVIQSAGNRVYFVGARGTWYPQHGLQFADYELTFRHPQDLNLVAAGEVAESRTEGGQRITRRVLSSPIRLAGFNLGDYERASAEKGGYRVEVYANREVEPALAPRPLELLVLPPPGTIWNRNRRRPNEVIAIPVEPSRPDPTARLRAMASDIASAFEFMAGRFGPPPMKTLTVSPIPGSFGQGFPGLLYLSTMSYIAPRERPAGARGQYQQLFYDEILHAHETAHQWWGNTVASEGYQHDWLMEALANYSALLYLEKKSGARALESVLDEYRRRLLTTNDEGRTLESAGPVVWGGRLNSSQFPGAWRSIIYEKGSWIVHMLRRRLGDAPFFKMLGELTRRYRFQSVDTEQFRALASEFLPPRSGDPNLEAFFDHWVYGTGIPSLRMKHAVKGKAPHVRVIVTVEQSGIGGGDSIDVPVEIQFRKSKPVTQWISTSEEPATVTVVAREAPVRVVLNPGRAVLSR